MCQAIESQTESIAQSLSEVMLSFGEDDNTKMVGLFQLLHHSHDLLEQHFLLVAIPRSTAINCLFCTGLLCSFLTDLSGTYTEYKAVSIGAGCEGATDMLKDLYKPVVEENGSYKQDLSLKDGIKIALSILKQVMKDTITGSNIDVATVTETGYKLHSDDEVEQYLSLLNSIVC